MEDDDYKKKDNERNNRTITVAIILLIIFVLILILFLFLIRSPAFFGSFAQSQSGASTASQSTAVSPQAISFDNSYLFASPLKAHAGAERIRITAYILDEQGMGVNGKKVVLGQSGESFHIYPVSDITDSSGRATFDVGSDQAGLYALEASVDGKKLSQRVTITFE